MNDESSIYWNSFLSEEDAALYDDHLKTDWTASVTGWLKPEAVVACRQELAQDDAKASMAKQGFVLGGDCLDALKYGLQAQLGKTQSISDAVKTDAQRSTERYNLAMENYKRRLEQVQKDTETVEVRTYKVIAEKEPLKSWPVERDPLPANTPEFWAKIDAFRALVAAETGLKRTVSAHIPIEEALPNRPCPHCGRNPSEPHHTYCRKFSPAKPETSKAAVAALAPPAKANAARFGCGRNV